MTTTHTPEQVAERVAGGRGYPLTPLGVLVVIQFVPVEHLLGICAQNLPQRTQLDGLSVADRLVVILHGMLLSLSAR